MATADGGQQEPDGSQLAVPDGSQVPGRGQQLPDHLTIGTKNAFERNIAFPYKKKQIGEETIYLCNKGSDWARADEVLVLRCETNEDSGRRTWTAFDSVVTADGSTLSCRQAVFRCSETDITQPGWHDWETNYAATSDEEGRPDDWHGTVRAETRLE